MKRPRLSTVVGALAGAAGMLYFVDLVRRTDALGRIGETAPALLWAVPLAIVPIALGTWSWALCFPTRDGGGRPRLRALFTIRLAGEAINNGLASAYVAGEPVKGLLAARSGASQAGGMASVLIGKTTFIFGEVVFLALGVVVAALLFGRAAPLVTLFACIAAGGLVVVVLGVLLQHRRPLFRGARLLRTLRLGPRQLWDRALPRADAIDGAVRHFYREQRLAFALSVACASAGWLLGAAELWIFLHVACGLEQALPLAIALECGIAVTKGLSFFVPGSIGVQEGGIASLFAVTGVGPEAGAAYAILRRFRELVWIGLGFLALWWHLQGARAEGVVQE